jgi:hypothetical protein
VRLLAARLRKIKIVPEKIPLGTASQLHSLRKTAQGEAAMMSLPYVDGITNTVTHDFRSSLTAGQIAASQDTLTVSVVCPDRWFFGDFAVLSSRDGRAYAGKVEGMDVCTGEVTIRLRAS